MHNALRLITATTTLLAMGTTASAQLTEDFKITADDEATGDLFGNAVAISGTTAVIGAVGDDDTGFGDGSAYIVDITTGQQLFRLTADRATSAVRFGEAVAISGTTAVVGAPRNAGLLTNHGSAYVFDTTTGQQLFRLTDGNTTIDDTFGYSVAISGTTVIVGDAIDDHAGVHSGSAYLFDTATGHLLFKLTADDAEAGDQFGISVGISGTTAIIGARGEGDGGDNAGAAYLFDTATGQQLFKLTADDARQRDEFGYSVAISGTTAIVGSWRDESAGSGTDSGSAYLFDTTTGQQLFKLRAADEGPNDELGTAVAISGTIAIAGSPNDRDAGFATGSAYAFDTTTGQQRFKLTARDGAARDELGISVAISNATVMAGAWLDDDSGSGSGASYVFTVCFDPCNGADVAAPYCRLNFDDIDVFVNGFLSGDLAVADCDGSGVVNTDDLDCFVAAFLAGCP